MKKWLKRLLPVLLLTCFWGWDTQAQEVVMKTNLLYDLTSTLNLGGEMALSEKWTIDLSVSYNSWAFGSKRRFRHYQIQPEGRYWLCEGFNGHFWGFHGLLGGYNVGGMKLFGMKNHRYEGRMAGAGISYGYHWILGDRWGLEATLGLGYIRLSYDKYPCTRCGSLLDTGSRNFWGPTKAGISLIYIIK